MSLNEQTEELIDGESRVKSQSKLDKFLRDLLIDNAILARSAEGPDDAALSALNPLLSISGGMVVIDIGAEDAQATLEQLTAMGMLHGAAFAHTVSGLIPISLLPQLEGMEGIRFARASLSTSFVGDVTNQADPALLADDARGEYNIDGTGVSIGVLSDSFDNLGGYAGDIASGDLPAGITVLEDLGMDGSDEGRAMLQIIHDIAPGADLLFHTAFLGVANFAQGIIDLANAGADVIVDDVAYLTQPFFQDGVIAQAADQVTAMGVAYFSSAGNSDDDSYQSAFNASGITELGAEAHDFDPGAGVDTRLSFTLDDNDTIQISFQWDQPFFSVSGGAGSTSDVDIFIVEAGTDTVVAQGFANNIGADPVEFVEFTNETGSAKQYEIIINVFTGPNPGLMKFIDFSGDANWTDPWFVGAPTSFGHTNAAGTFSVGAARYTQTPEFGEDPPLIEPFSSLGGTPILFDTAGNRLANPEIRNNVDFTAVDGGDTTFFGSDFDGNGFPNFFGTSASAPAAAAVAALLYQIAPNATRADIEAALVASAIDMGAPGYDFLTGAGLIQATGAVFELLNLTENVLVGTEGVDVFDARAFDDTLEGRGGDDILNGGDGIDTAIYSGNRADYTITETSPGKFTISGPDGTDSLENIEFAQFLDQTVDLSDLDAPNLIEGTPNPDTLDGTADADEIRGLASNDILRGFAGNDILDGGLGDDDMSGGLGDDIFVIDSAGDTVTENGGEGFDTIRTFIDLALPATLYANFERFELFGSAFKLAGNGLANVLVANDSLLSILNGNGGADTLIGGAQRDLLYGGAGDDM
ncbi:S8 family serine peptidase, partial [Aurantiacibacter sp. D1-12]|uniref:S8 family serine peptidase n=1 Tax=Aurantiacibacter sp. D1-12 TaxID=2993658 RepID=UPI00237C79D5